MTSSLVGSEMCIRDRPSAPQRRTPTLPLSSPWTHSTSWPPASAPRIFFCLLYASDAADDM
eukprot:1460927-Prorocentrum_lima.AAC.1